jgi:hypothetical protein
MAPIAIRAFNFIAFGRPVPGARIFALGAPGVTLAVTDHAGRAVVHRSPGQEVTLVLEKPGFVTTQSATLVVPVGGLSGGQQETTFQTLPTWAFAATKRWLRVPTLPGRRHLATTVTAAGMTLYDRVQGESRAVVRITRDGRELDVTPIYLGILPLVHKTDLIRARWRRGEVTSADGGVLFPNLEVGTYELEAQAPGRRFAVARAVVGADSPEFINLSPPWGPRVISTGTAEGEVLAERPYRKVGLV